MAKVGLREFTSLARVLADGRLLRYGKGARGATAAFETAFAAQMGCAHVLTVNSGTSALIAALAAAGIGPGDEVLVPAYTWVSTAIAPLAVGAVPVLVDIDESLTIDPAAIEARITPWTRAIMPVHMLNLPCDMAAVMDIARRHGLVVVEDACQAIGVTYRGRPVGTIGDLGAMSFNHHKNMTAGEGGAVLTDDERLFVRAQMYHDPGNFIRGLKSSEEPVFSAMNLRVSELTGAMLNAQLPRLAPLMKRLRRRHGLMARALEGAPGCRISPHNDADAAVGLTVIFDRAEDARAFGDIAGVERLLDTDRHVFANWEAVLSKRAHHPRMNPYAWANREIEHRVEDHARTLDILGRTCRVALGAQYPLPVMAYRARVLRRALARRAPGYHEAVA
ncbi:DegT/DnrJ/EryC1/StrS family aminotransferase [Marinibacterium sp. SX1]|uniref:DegT/DnrJ/EryC1/StrS family aminotransferase n=1 Tax=Marinibacterium sp. SX1 TaxID=3388424 RepID=UPI003D16EA10